MIGWLAEIGRLWRSPVDAPPPNKEGEPMKTPGECIRAEIRERHDAAEAGKREVSVISHGMSNAVANMQGTASEFRRGVDALAQLAADLGGLNQNERRRNS